ncbi:hypothetical protein GLAREA_07615 [Glarea lozoyensis ATCC 20868]|uniref:Uncharacterized protein n=1 Tax=Glarea lozoyensis (strain ATCC 20868 / MF5171) TaxID=1116229 RepID=S3D1Q4_GLAL2|nr:uncharacterized protein GLAREA_07615 [Glarea lozoyensis ATCC 20868]EPE32482.1 hypothetical protein GLAREA_07615 [Glarea lozoyensis ATCC 20868]
MGGEGSAARRPTRPAKCRPHTSTAQVLPAARPARLPYAPSHEENFMERDSQGEDDKFQLSHAARLAENT